MPGTCLRLLAALLLLLLAVPAPQAAPLLQEGKKTLYQRVVSHPGALPLQEARDGAPAAREVLVPFTALYVYARQDDWLQVGLDTRTPLGWLKKDQVTDWNQSLTLLFTPRTGRDPVLFFKTDTALKGLCEAPDMEKQLDDLNAAAAGGKDAAALPILAAEPAEQQGAVDRNRFYLMPILGIDRVFEGVNLLQVASIDPGSSQSGAVAGPPRTGIALVLDTSISMRPYIEQSRDIIRQLYDRLEKDKMTDNVGFAVVAFRSSTKKTPGLGYTSQVVSDFATAQNRKALESRLAKVEQATVSSHDFNEDSLAGIHTAIESLNWAPYSTRLILLVTDAGPLRADDPYASQRLGAAEMNDLARQKGIWITTMHVKTPGGSKNHAYAEQAYRALSRITGDQANYQAVNASSHKEAARQFGIVTKILTTAMVDMVRNTASGKVMTRPREESLPTSPEEQARQLAERLGYAMQLDYLGSKNANRAPSVVDAWIADMDLKKLAQGRQVPSMEVAVLLTKNQLSDLSTQLKNIIDNAERTKKTDSRDFFQGILSASARMARDPNLPTQGKNLAELGVLAEFLDGLPYKSDIMLLREDDWYRMSIGEQTAFINRLKSRLARYEEYDRDRANWESFGQDNAGDWVYRVPLSMLP